MKKIFTLIIVLAMTISMAGAATLKTAVTKYKSGNYVGCMGDLENVAKTYSRDPNAKAPMKKMISVLSKYDLARLSKKMKSKDYSDPEIKNLYKEFYGIVKLPKSEYDKVAYMFYYYALSLHQIGLAEEAKLYYSAAAFFTPDSPIGVNSRGAIKCIERPDACATSDMDEFVRSGKTVSDDIIRQELQDNLKMHHENINKNAGAPMPRPVVKPAAPATDAKKTDKTSYNIENEKIAWVDAGVPTGASYYADEEDSKSDNRMPSDAEIGRAVRTLQKAGINPMNYPSTMDNQYAQINALLNDGNYSYGYNPMMYGNQKLSPEVMQTLLQQQMMMGQYNNF